MSADIQETALAAGALAAAGVVLPGLPPLRIAFFNERPDGRLGEYDRPTGTVYVKAGLDDGSIIRTVLHEAVHAGLAEARAARRLPYALTGRLDEGHRVTAGWEEALAERVGRLDPEAVKEVRAQMAAHPVAVKAVDAGWLDQQRTLACSYAKGDVLGQDLTLSSEARRNAERTAASCAAPKSTDPLVEALTARLHGWDEAHGAAVRPGTTRTVDVATLRARRGFVERTRRELGIAAKDADALVAGCSVDQALCRYDGARNWGLAR